MNSVLIFDVGMHKGEDTDYYLRRGFNVVGIEPNPDLAELCKIRFQDAIARERLHIVEGAIAPSSTEKTVTFFKNTLSVWGTIDPGWSARNASLGWESTAITLPRVDIKDVFQRFGVPFYLKIDVEGVDLLVLDSLYNMDARPKYVSIESDKVDFGALEAELRTLSDLGYSRFKVVQQESIPGTTISTTTLDGRSFDYTFERDASGPFGEDIAGPWLSMSEVLEEYRRIFKRYRYFGDNSIFVKLPPRAQRPIDRLYKAVTGYRGPLPGWFDTHAAR